MNLNNPIAMLALHCLPLLMVGCSPASAPESDGAGDAGRQAQIPGEMVIETPQAGAEVTSPIQLSGTVPGTWYFEGSFPLRLVDAGGEVLAEGLAESQGNWMTEAPVDFQAEISFSVEAETKATLILKEDDPSGQQAVSQARLPLVLKPDR